MSCELTGHARDALQERKIPVEWMERVLANPALAEPSATDATLESRLGEDSGTRRPGVAGGGEQDGCP